ncbi:hypothetical protein [Lysinibacillus sp. Ag94]|uniref:hypothetical protein n=1 Tax=Lysinibacillus sp. Ag94 TaxID=2936682 RepID=UPI00200EAF89|nr:hypothetical protein [Lysinibacillus sp. Ag94]UPW82338.1 hypothetical protein MY533_16525 [Lysinibacillus sp. Ag94]
MLNQINTLKHLTISLCEPNGDSIISFDVNDHISVIVPNVGDKVCVDGIFRVVTQKVFQYLPNMQTAVVEITLKEN